jgi:hypothetical protein
VFVLRWGVLGRDSVEDGNEFPLVVDVVIDLGVEEGGFGGRRKVGVNVGRGCSGRLSSGYGEYLVVVTETYFLSRKGEEGFGGDVFSVNEDGR